MENSPLRLSIEELALLLDMLMIQQLPGQAALSLPAPVTDHAGLLRASVTRSLLARSLLLPLADGSVAVHGDVQRLLHLAAAPDAVLLVTSKSGDTLPPQQESYYRLGGVVVRIFQPYDGIYEFAPLLEPFDLTAALVGWLQRHSAAESEPDLQLVLSQNSLSQAQTAANQGAGAEAEQILRQAGASASVSIALAEAMSTPTARLQVTALAPYLQPAVPSETLLCEARRCWRMQGGPHTEVTVTSVDLEQMQSALQGVIDQWADARE